MQIHQIKPTTKNKKAKRVGRGGKKGTYSGRGVKGQKSRAGHKKAPVIREIIKKYHKLKGYNFSTVSEKAFIVNVSTIDKNFNSGDKVNPEKLSEKRIIKGYKTKKKPVKILGNGSINKAINFEGVVVSKSAAEKIEKAGGKILK